MKRRAFLAGAGTAVTAGVAGCVGSGAESEGDFDVGMGPTYFDPPDIEVAVGDAVVWKNTNSRTHTVTAVESSLPADAAYFASGGYDSQSAAEDAYYNHLEGGIPSGGTYSHTFDVPGTYPYYCIPHEAAGMDGTVTVTEE